MNPPPSTLQTPGFAHYAVSWSPFHPTRLAVASAANYGLVGNGRLHIVSLGPPAPAPTAAAVNNVTPSLQLEKSYPTQDGLYDVAWSEVHENQVVSASGDGALRLWDVALNDLPIRAWQEHSREVFSVDWSNVKKDTFCSSSWDGTVKVWRPDHPHSLATLQAHHQCVYQALFSPHQPDVLASCSSDGTLKLFDLRSPSFLSSPTGPAHTSLSAPALLVPPTGGELLSIDWNKYRPYVLAAAGTDKKVRVWDCRMIKPPGSTAAAAAAGIGDGEGPVVGANCEVELLGHEYAVRKVQWSPHRPDVLASASYDMTCRVWTTNPPPGRPHLTYIHDAHTEFVVGCGWSLFEEGLLATCSWDSRLQLVRL